MCPFIGFVIISQIVLVNLWSVTATSRKTHRDIPGQAFASLLGYQSNCKFNGIPQTCTLSVACWWIGGRSESGCGGSSSWIIACCVTNSIKMKKQIAAQTIQKRNSLNTEDFNDECGISYDRLLQKRIIGGAQAQFAQFPWQVYIKISSYQCGGALISRRYVATAAHCVLTTKSTELLVYLGDLDTQDTGDVDELVPAELHRVKRRLIHPNFRYQATQPDRFDLALLELVHDAGLNLHIVPICLPDISIGLIGRSAVVAGWGKTDPLSKKTSTNVLRSVTVPILDAAQCMAWHRIRQIRVELHDEMICAGLEIGQQDACHGDSGGPLILLENGKWTLVGITSAGYGCGEPHQPGIYHKIPSSIQWIQQVISKQ